MSDAQPPPDPTPAPEAPPTAPAPAPSPVAPGPSPQAASRPPIDYALPAPKKSWLPTPQMVRNIGCLVKMIAAFTFLLCLAYFALVALNPKARQWALQGTKPGPGGAPPTGKGPTPFKALNQVLAIPAQAMGKTDDVVKANNARVGVLDGVIKEEEGKGKGARGSRPVVDPFATSSAAGGTSRPDQSTSESAEAGPQAVSSATIMALAEKRGATVAPEPQTPEPKPQTPRSQTQDPGPQTPDEMKLAGDIVIAHASPAGAPRASAVFFYSVVKFNVSGITQGKPARALINNRLAYEGDEINRPLGIVFAELDAANKLLVFKDKSGATVTRSY